jgi:hypothetical protein
VREFEKGSGWLEMEGGPVIGFFQSFVSRLSGGKREYLIRRKA